MPTSEKIGRVSGLPPDAQGVPDQQIELVVRLVVIVGIDEAQVDRGMAAIGDDREQDVVAKLWRPVAHLDRLDALVEQALIGLEGRRWLCGQDLTTAG